MRIIENLQSTAARAATIRPTTDARLHGGNLVRAINRRYGFLEFPTRVSDFDYQRGVRFVQGLFEGYAIDLEVLENGVKALSKQSTDLCDIFIDDLFRYATRMGAQFEEVNELRVYSSAVEFEMNGDFDREFAKFASVGARIGAKVAGYGGPEDSYRGIGWTFVGRLVGPAPAPFRIERRVNHPFDANVFYSIAPLRTQDHLDVLGEIERLIA